MRFIAAALFVLAPGALMAAPRTEVIEGVPFRCVNAVRYELIREFARENHGDAAAVEEYRELVRSAPAYACRERKRRNVEHVSWCDGSGCTGATATLKSGKCAVSDRWSGQDDGDLVDPEEHAKECLLEADFRD